MIYDLDIDYFLFEDIQFVINKIKHFYDFELENGRLVFYSKIVIDKSIYWASDESDNIFNVLVPQIKSLHNDMYRVTESIYNQRNEIDFNWKNLEKTYPIIREFTFLNNRFKHYHKKHGLKITLTKVVQITKTQTMDLLFNFFENDNYSKSIPYQKFVNFFLTFLIDNGLITIS